MNKPTPAELIANPSAYGMVRVSGAKLHREANKGSNTKVELTSKFSYFRPATDGDPAVTLVKLRDAFGPTQVLNWIGGSQSVKVQQENAVRPLLRPSGKGGEVPPKLKGSDEAGMTLASAEALLGGSSSRSIVTVDRPVYITSDGQRVDSPEQLALVNKALAKLDRKERARLLDELDSMDAVDEAVDYDDLDTPALAELVRQVTELQTTPEK